MQIGQYVIVRSSSAGVFAGELDDRIAQEVTLRNARRLWYWDGAASCSELAVRGVSKPKSCKFPPAVPEIVLSEAIEIIAATPEARESIEAVPDWTYA